MNSRSSSENVRASRVLRRFSPDEVMPMLEKAYADAGHLHRVRVRIPDRPGVIAAIAQALGAERINISDFQLQHDSPERGGTMTLLVTGEGEATRAAELLEAQGYGVVVSAVLDEE